MSEMTNTLITYGFICGLVVVIVAGVLAARLLTKDRTRRGLSPTLLKMYGLLSVAGFALLLSVVETQSEIKTAAFTLLGTIAGYLAGTRIRDEPAIDDAT